MSKMPLMSVMYLMSGDTTGVSFPALTATHYLGYIVAKRCKGTHCRDVGRQLIRGTYCRSSAWCVPALLYSSLKLGVRCLERQTHICCPSSTRNTTKSNIVLPITLFMLQTSALDRLKWTFKKLTKTCLSCPKSQERRSTGSPNGSWNLLRAQII